MSDSIAPVSNEISDTLVLSEKIETLNKNKLVALPINCLIAASVVALMRHSVERGVLTAWLAAIILINFVRFVISLRSRCDLSRPLDARRILRFHSASALASGLVWAFVPAFMLDVGTPEASSALVILTGVSAGAAVLASSLAIVGGAFMVPILGTVFVKFVLFGGESDLILALDVVLFTLFLLRSTTRGEAAFTAMVHLKIKANRLAASLETEHAAFRDASDRLYRLANQDALTGLGNRAAFSDKLSGLLASSRDQGSTFALFLLDLDHFKSVNDTLGHGVGDKVLMEAATRLSSVFDTDHVVARLGGDEFAILLADLDAETADGEHIDDVVARLSRHVLARVSGAFQVGRRLITIGVSLGVATFPEDGTNAEDLLAHADLALYAAKDGGRQQWRRFDEDLLSEAHRARDIEHDLETALSDGSLEVWFQPQVALCDLRLTGLEALLRWRHPVHGWIAPPLTVAAALRTRKSDLLTGFVLDAACRQIQTLRAAGHDDVLVAVNISPSELDHYALPPLVQRAIDAHGIDPRALELEITEEAFAASPTVLTTLSALSDLGVRLAIDDFGAGYSSIAYLSRMRVNRIKIDRGFVSGFAERPNDRILVQAILGIGRSFNIDVLAEGVELPEEAVLLQAFGCHTAQGYYFGYPMEPAVLSSWIAALAKGSVVLDDPTGGRVGTGINHVPTSVAA